MMRVEQLLGILKNCNKDAQIIFHNVKDWKLYEIPYGNHRITSKEVSFVINVKEIAGDSRR